MRNRFFVVAASLALAAAPLQAQYAPAGLFGVLPANSFGGSGIPTNAVMVGGFGGVTIGLSATQRYTSPALGNNGAGTFYTTVGYSTGDPDLVNAPDANWNLDYYIGGANSGNFFYALMGTFAPGFGPASAPNGGPIGPGGDSFNVAGPNLAALIPGQWTFALIQYNQSLAEVDRVAINVDVNVTPEPASLVLLGTGLLGVVGVARRRRA